MKCPNCNKRFKNYDLDFLICTKCVIKGYKDYYKELKKTKTKEVE